MQDQEIIELLQQVKTIALVGASDNPSRPSYGVMAYLLAQGYQVIPVSPKLAGQTLLGQPVYATLAAIPQPVDMVDVFLQFRGGLRRGARGDSDRRQGTVAADRRD